MRNFEHEILIFLYVDRMHCERINRAIRRCRSGAPKRKLMPNESTIIHGV